MAPLQPAQLQKDRRVKAILTFASELEAQLPTSASSKTSGSLLQETQENIAQLLKRDTTATGSKGEEIDRCGTAIWNLCTRLRRQYDTDNPHDVPLVLLLARVYAFLLLDCAHQNGKSISGNLQRLMKIGLKAGKSCLDRKQSDLALNVLEKVATYESAFTDPNSELGEEERKSCDNLVAEYYVLRTAAAWHKSQVGVAEMMYTKSISSQILFDPQTAESLADVIYEIGKDLLEKKDYQLASKWLNRSYKVLSLQELDKLSIDANELRISIMESLIKALLGLESSEAFEEATSLVTLLESELGDKLLVLILKLELLSAATPENFDSSSYSDILRRMTRTMYLNNNNFRLIMFHIRKLNDKSPSLACKALDDFMTLRLLKAEDLHESWIGKTLVTRLWITVNQRDAPEAVQSLHDLFEVIVLDIPKPIPPNATLAAHTLLWKRIESNYAQSQYETAEKWCRLGLHRIFATSGEINTARLSRKLLLCALARTDVGSAREIFSSMSDSARNEPMSRFLMYKIAIRGGDTALAAECLQSISAAARTTQDITLLYGCVLDAQRIGDKPQTLAGLQLVLEKADHGAKTAVHLPSLLRLTISLIMSLLDEESKQGSLHLSGTIDKLCGAFEKGFAAFRRARDSSKTVDPDWTIDELEWFSKNSYNLAIKYLSSWNPRSSLRMLKSCTEFMNQYPKDLGEQVYEDLSLRKMFCAFSAATALVSLARGEDNIENQMQDYLNVRKHVDTFDILLQEKVENINEDMEADLRRKLSILAAFDFEAACRLKAWDDLGESVLKADACKSAQVYEIMADIILCSEAPTPVRIATLKKIINEAWGLESLDITKLAKYMRCLFQIAVSDNPGIAEQLLDQVHNHAEEASESEQPYPSEELEWISARAFNHAIDLYCTGDDEGCKNWADRALNIAHHVNDGGSLERLLQNKLLGLKFDS